MPFRGGILFVLLVLRHKIVHVGRGLSELHFIHTPLTGVPVEEGLAVKICCSLFCSVSLLFNRSNPICVETGFRIRATLKLKLAEVKWLSENGSNIACP